MALVSECAQQAFLHRKLLKSALAAIMIQIVALVSTDKVLNPCINNVLLERGKPLMCVMILRQLDITMAI